MTRWEYMTTASLAMLSALGQQGWELVTVDAQRLFYLKRAFEDYRPMPVSVAPAASGRSGGPWEAAFY